MKSGLTFRLVSFSLIACFKPSVSLPQCGISKASLFALTIFLITLTKIQRRLEPSHYDATYGRISQEPVVLAVSDTLVNWLLSIWIKKRIGVLTWSISSWLVGKQYIGGHTFTGTIRIVRSTNYLSFRTTNLVKNIIAKNLPHFDTESYSFRDKFRSNS